MGQFWLCLFQMTIWLHIKWDGFATISMRSWTKFYSNILDILKLRSGLYVWANLPRTKSGSKVSSRELPCKLKLLNSSWVYMWSVPEFNSPGIPPISQSGGESVNTTEALSYIYIQTDASYFLFCHINLIELFSEFKMWKINKTPPFTLEKR